MYFYFQWRAEKITGENYSCKDTIGKICRNIYKTVYKRGRVYKQTLKKKKTYLSHHMFRYLVNL